jgi:23S rRNA-/tRNA-specific pseudouridylate synthase
VQGGASERSLAAAAASGRVLLNNRAVAAHKALYVKQGDAVRLLPPPAPPTLALADILFEDPVLLVVNKPAGLASAPSPGATTSALQSLEALLSARDGAQQTLFPLHRLDMATSGVLMLAKAARVCAPVSRAFRVRNGVSKTYLALLRAPPGAGDEGCWTDLLLSRNGRAHVDAAGKAAHTDWRVLERFSGGGCAVALSPRTGRMHQLRAQGAARGAPVVGDALYGGGGGAAGALCLHCWRMEMEHPAEEGRRMRFEASVPAGLAAQQERMRGRPARGAAAGG